MPASKKCRKKTQSSLIWAILTKTDAAPNIMPKETPIKSSLDELKNRAFSVPAHLELGYTSTSPDMPLKKMAGFAASNPTMHAMFQPVLDEAKQASTLLKAVVEGEPAKLIQLVQTDPRLLFKKGQIKDPAGRVFYNVSAYQMMKYLCDEDMITQVMPHVLEKITNKHGRQIDLKAIQEEQDQTLQGGGADLIKLNFDPTNPSEFDRILQHIETYRISGQPHPVTFSLMENPDAILYYKDTDGTPNWYYANRETQTIKPIQPQPQTEDDVQQFTHLEQSIDAMENNSARRSSYAEHDIIKKSMQKSLVRNGIPYEQDGQCFCDTHHDFNRLYNAYRKYNRLYNLSNKIDINTIWCKEVGLTQKEVIWLLQRYCEEKRPFFPLPDFKSSPFNRGFNIRDLIANKYKSVFNISRFVRGFGSDFAIYKADLECAVGGGPSAGRVWDVFYYNRIADLVAVNRLIEDAKANVIEFKPKELLSQGPSIR